MDKSICHSCNIQFKDKEKRTTCSVCDRIFHLPCGNLPVAEYNVLNKQTTQVHWYCPSCEIGAKSLYRKMIVLSSQFLELESKVSDLQGAMSSKISKEEVDQIITTKVTDLEGEIRGKITKEEVDQMVESEISKHENKMDEKLKVAQGKSPNIDKIATEVAERDSRKDNIIMHNIPEVNQELLDQGKDDAQQILDILKFIQPDMEQENIRKTYRLGKRTEDKKRPVCVVLKDNQTKSKILSAAKKLKDSRYKEIGIANDLTKTQRDELKKLRDEAKARSTDEMTYIVTGKPGFWKVVQKTKE